MTPPPPRTRAITHLVSPAQIAAAAFDLTAWIEARCLDHLHVPRERATITWEAERPGPAPQHGQPHEPVERLPWTPGAALPAGTDMIICHVVTAYEPT